MTSIIHNKYLYFFSVTGMLGQIYYCTIITAILAHFANSASIDVKGELISKYFFISVYIFFCKFLLNCSQKWHFVSKIVLTYCEKKYSRDLQKHCCRIICFYNLEFAKGQLISKGIFAVFNFFPKQTKTSRPEVS